MARPAARGLKVVINNQDSWKDDERMESTPLSVPKSAGASLTLPTLNSGGRASPNLMDRSPLNGFSKSYDFEEGNGIDAPSTASASPAISQSSGERALAEFALTEEIHVAQRAIDLFLNNQILEAKRMLESKIADNMYAAVAHSTLLYLQALMTVTAEDARAAVKALRDTQALCAKRCRGRFSRSKRTEEQVHAELCHAECGLMLSALVLSEDPSLAALVKAGIRFKSSHSTYQTCIHILRDREWSSDELRGHFESGVRLGNGAFNLIFSCVPSKHAKYLSMVGFSGIAKVGNAELKSGSMTGALRGTLCAMVLIGWECYGKIMLGSGICDVDYAAEMLTPLEKQYPNGAVMLFLHGRVAQLKGQFTEALDYFNRSMRAQSEWKQYQHLCMWESMWCYCFTLDFMAAAELAHFLYKENQWSKSTYAYLTASFLLMMDRQEATLNGESVTVDYMMKEVIAKKQRIAGQSIPPEKLAEKRYKRLYEQEKDLIFPAFELSYVWGGMTALCHRPDIVQDILNLIDAKLTDIGPARKKDRKRIHDDSIYILKFLRGVCLSYLNRIDEAQRILDEIVNAEKEITEDKFLPPHAAVEMAQMKLRLNDLEGAMKYCNRAAFHAGFRGDVSKDEAWRLYRAFRNYFMQAKLELRIGATMEMIEEHEEGLNRSPTDADSLNDETNEFYTPPSSPEPA